MERAGKKVKKVLSNYDFSLILLVLFLCIFGLIMIYSTSYYNADHYYNEENLYFKRQLQFIGAGLVIMILVSMFDYHLLVKNFFKKINLAWVLYIVSLLLQIFIIFAGYSSNGSSRWVNLGISNFQPSEFTKVVAVISGAFIVSSRKKRLDSFLGFITTFVWMIPHIGLIALQNLSSAIIVAGIFVSMCFVVSKKKLYYGIVVILAVAAVVGFIALKGYRAGRISQWLNVEEQSGSQILQGLYAIASGGLFGKGLGNGIMKKGQISEVHTDMIFSIICEELGIIGGIMLIALFLILLWKIFKIARNAPDIYGGLMATGVLVHIAVQSWIHVAVVTSLIPPTGAVLPFVSYGGSSLIMMMAEMGLVLSVSKYTYTEKEESEEDENEKQI